VATQTMGQLYCGQAFGNRWNRAWEWTCSTVFGTIQDVTIDKIPQDLFDQLLATAFWMAADGLGGVPKRVESVCSVPARPVKTWPQLAFDLAEWRRQAGC
jgi:hypothetical protein